MDKMVFSDISQNIERIVKDEMGGDFIQTSVKDYPPLETEIIDYEQRMDDAFFSKGEKCKSFEIPNAKGVADMIIDIPSTAPTNLTLKYFLDGSFRTYYWGDVEINNLSFPVIVGETVVGVVKREDKVFKTAALSKKLNIVLPPETYQEIKELREKLLNVLGQKYSWINIVALEKDQAEINELRTAMLGKIRAILHNEEREEASKLQKGSEEILVIDGDLRKDIFANLPGTIGLAKSFSLKPVIVGWSHDIPVPKVLRYLKKGQRTCVFIKEDASQYKFWYIRLRDIDECENYWQGIVKVEVNIKNLDKATADFIDYVNQISRLIYEERIPSSFPQKRWASHIYPISVAERLAKNSLTSPHAFRQLLKI